MYSTSWREIYDIEPPSDGPIDLLIDFTSPYYLGQRRTADKIKMLVWVVNKKSGMMQPTGDITIKSVGDFPEWLECEEEGDEGCGRKCVLNRAEGTFTLEDFSQGRFLRLKNPVKYVCNLQINSLFPSDVSYQTATFTGEMEYHYTISASTNSMSVDRTFCD